MIKRNGKWECKESFIFFAGSCAEIPFLLVGISINSIKYIIILLFFTLSIGISEEIYFRGIILKLLEEKYLKKNLLLFLL